jgi:hypothetical protein
MLFLASEIAYATNGSSISSDKESFWGIIDRLFPAIGNLLNFMHAMELILSERLRSRTTFGLV